MCFEQEFIEKSRNNIYNNIYKTYIQHITYVTLQLFFMIYL